MIKIPFAILANESFNAIPMASARVDKETIKPEVDNSSIAAHAKTNMTRQIILMIKAIKDAIERENKRYRSGDYNISDYTGQSGEI